MNYIAKSTGISSVFKETILKISMPKFIWVCEIIENKGFRMDDQNINSVIALDATESGLQGHFLFAKNPESLIIKPDQTGSYHFLPFENEYFKTYNNNLKGEHTQWEA